MNVRFGELQVRDPIAVAAGVPGLINSVGTDEFQDHLVGYLHELSGINQCGVYQYRDSQLLGRGAGSVNRSSAAQHQELFISSGYWQHDERIATTRRLLDTS